MKGEELMSTRIVKLDEYQFLLCVKHGLWGATNNHMRNWKDGDHLVLKAGNYFAAHALVVGTVFESNEMIWDNDIFPYRVNLKFTHIISEAERSEISRTLKKILWDYYGPNYGWILVAKVPIKKDLASRMISDIYKTRNVLPELLENLDSTLNNLKKKRSTDKTGTFKVPVIDLN